MKAGPILFLVSLAAYAALAGDRLRGPSRHPHFVLQAEAWLDGRLDVARWPRGADDPARVDTVVLPDGARVRGRFLRTRPVFRTLDGEEIARERARRVGRRTYVSFPPFPAVVLLPVVALFGRDVSDPLVTVLLAALVPALMLGLLRRARERGFSRSTPAEERWLAVLLGFGTVFFFTAVQGTVWFTAHVVGVLAGVVYLRFALGGDRPWLAGAALGCAFLTRVPMLFLFPFFVLEARRAHPEDWMARVVRFAIPVALCGLAAAAHNFARFESFTEFGHRYLDVAQQNEIERWGLVHPAYLPRNLQAALALLPRLGDTDAWVSISGHGLAVWFTTPCLLLLLRRPREPSPLARAAWVSTACALPLPLLYMNTGWFQFGYRFALDVMPLLVLLLALEGGRLGRGFRALVVLAIAINLFGAVTFQRHPRFYRVDAETYSALAPLDWLGEPRAGP